MVVDVAILSVMAFKIRENYICNNIKHRSVLFAVFAFPRLYRLPQPGSSS